MDDDRRAEWRDFWQFMAQVWLAIICVSAPVGAAVYFAVLALNGS